MGTADGTPKRHRSFSYCGRQDLASLNSLSSHDKYLYLGFRVSGVPYDKIPHNTPGRKILPATKPLAEPVINYLKNPFVTRITKSQRRLYIILYRRWGKPFIKLCIFKIRVPFRVLFRSVPYYIGDPKRDANFENNPNINPCDRSFGDCSTRSARWVRISVVGFNKLCSSSILFARTLTP